MTTQGVLKPNNQPCKITLPTITITGTYRNICAGKFSNLLAADTYAKQQGYTYYSVELLHDN